MLCSLLLIFFYFLFTNLIWSVLSFTSYLLYNFSACKKNRGWYSFLSLVKMLLIYLTYYFFWYSNFTFLTCLFCFQIISLLKWSLNFTLSSWFRIENISKKYFLEECHFSHNQESKLQSYQYISFLLNKSYQLLVLLYWVTILSLFLVIRISMLYIIILIYFLSLFKTSFIYSWSLIHVRYIIMTYSYHQQLFTFCLNIKWRCFLLLILLQARV